ncbi:MAG: hypothetical protein ABS75_16790 [Pelagibacterium sp. SCN 63-23]|nr:MAG: hypothetical protein ABS75_16790 [Pelagibacterium sp. SCN 63-23]
MHRTWQIMAREAGLALAVLAVYVLVLLLPLHQAAGLQRQFDALGFAALDTFSVCTTLNQDADDEERDVAALTCPVAGTAKHQFTAVLPPLPLFSAPVATNPAHRARTETAIPARRPDHVGQPRAPPVSA